MCGTAPVEEASTQDAVLLKAAKEKQFKKTSLMRKKKEENKLKENVCSPEVSILSSAALSSFKMSKKRRMALSARSGPSAGNLFQSLQDDCFKCRRIRMIRGRDLINPLRHLSHTSMEPGHPAP